MQAIEFNSVIENGVIPVPDDYKKLSNSSVRVIVLVNEIEKNHPIDKSAAVDTFLESWSGILAEKTDEEIENARYKYLKEKYQ